LAQFKIDLTVVMEAHDQAEGLQRLQALLANYQPKINSVSEEKSIIKNEPVVAVVPRTSASVSDEPFVTFRVADEKFRVFAKDFGIQGTELKVARDRDFLMFRVRAFLEELGYTVESKTNVRVVAESHVEQVAEQVEKDAVQTQPADVYIKR